MLLAFERVNEILECDHLIESSWVIFGCSDLGSSQDEINVLKLHKIVGIVGIVKK